MKKVISLIYVLFALVLLQATSAFAEHHSLIVLSKDDRTVYDVEPATGKVLKSIQFDGVPTDAVFAWNEQSLFVAVPDQGYISIVDVPTFTEKSRLTAPEFKRTASSTGMLDSLATTPDYRRLYVSVQGGLESFDQELLVFAPEYKQTPNKIALPGLDGQHMLVHGPSNKLYYVFGKDNQVAVIDTLTDKVVKTIAVKGGPTDVVFNMGWEAWVAAADGSVSIIDIHKDEVVKTIQTGGKGASHLSIAHDVRYIAATHDDSGDVSVFQPVTKEILGTIKVEKGSPSAGFAPAGFGTVPGYMNGDHPLDYKYPGTNQLYITGQSTVTTVDLDKMAVTTHQNAGQNLTKAVIHYTYPNSFGDGSPRDETSSRTMDNDSFIYYNNAMAANDLSPIHEHRRIWSYSSIGRRRGQVCCWADHPPDASDAGRPSNQYNYGLANVGVFTAEPHGELHEEEGASPSPRRMGVFMMKNNYYRWMNPKLKSDFQGKPGFAPNVNMVRAWFWNHHIS